jgi:hypothetical protein
MLKICWIYAENMLKICIVICKICRICTKICIKICEQYAKTIVKNMQNLQCCYALKYAIYVKYMGKCDMQRICTKICKIFAKYVNQNAICRICPPHFADGTCRDPSLVGMGGSAPARPRSSRISAASDSDPNCRRRARSVRARSCHLGLDRVSAWGDSESSEVVPWQPMPSGRCDGACRAAYGGDRDAMAAALGRTAFRVRVWSSCTRSRACLRVGPLALSRCQHGLDSAGESRDSERPPWQPYQQIKMDFLSLFCLDPFIFVYSLL